MQTFEPIFMLSGVLQLNTNDFFFYKVRPLSPLQPSVLHLFILKWQGHFTFTPDNEGKKDVSTMKHMQHNYILLNLTSVLEITGVLDTGGPPIYKFMIQFN